MQRNEKQLKQEIIMKPIKMNDASNYESINVTLSKERTPIAYNNKLDELKSSMAFETTDEAKEWLDNTPIELELYYENGYGLFAVEADAVENSNVKSPYSGAPILDEQDCNKFDDSNIPQYSDNFINAVLSDDLINSIINVEKNSKENSDEKIQEIRGIIFNAITGKNLKYFLKNKK